ncbi:MAG: autotransporter-associated beta strand repeat-containing protein [Prosthecobacter sp.]
MRLFCFLAFLIAACSAGAVSIDAIYFGQTHLHKPDNPYFGTVGGRDVFIKVHVTDPAAVAAPSVFATLNLAGQFLTVQLTGPATLPTSIPDGLGVVQHSTANSFTGVLPAAWIKTGLQVTVNAGSVVSTVTDMKVSAPTKVIMTMTDVHYFARTPSDYTAGTFAELEQKWPVQDLELRRLNNVVFRELVIPPRADVSAQGVRIRSKAEYQGQTGLAFDGEQAAALQWNGALKAAAGRSGRWSLYYLNVYGAFAGGQAGGYAGVGNGNDIGILNHELGHALSLPHWGDNAAYPYKGAMHGINAPSNYNGTHAGPAWAIDQRTNTFIPCTVVAGNVGGKPVGTYTVDPMQGGGEGWQPAGFLMNHFSDYSVNQMRNYVNSHVVVWNPALSSGNGSWAQWNQTAGDYTTVVTNNGVQFPQQRDVQVISILASMSGAKPTLNMVYPPIGPYTAGLIRLFDPTVAADRTAAQSIYAPTNGCDYCVRVVQGGVTKTYMLAASSLTSPSLTDLASLETEAVNLPAADGAVTRIELLSTPNVEDVGLPANPTVFYTWGPLMPAVATFDSPPEANGPTAVTMTAEMGEVGYGYTGGTVEYLFTETSGNPGATSSAWQTSRTYTDTGLQPGTNYTYTVSMRAGTLSSTTSAPVSVTTTPTMLTGTIAVNATQQFSVASGSGYKAVTGLGTFDAATADKLVVVIGMENANNDPCMIYGVRYNGVQMIEAVQQTGGNADGTIAIYYLDNPGAVGTGITVSGYNPNGGLGVAYALSGTAPGFGASNSRLGNAITQVPLTTSASNSLVIAGLQNSGNGNSAGTPTANAPLTQSASGNWGSQWGSLAVGHIQVASPGAVTPAFTTTTGGSYSINGASIEVLAETQPLSTWTQTAGGAQSWNTAANWIANTVPSTVSGDTVDFSTVDIAANTSLTLEADRTGGLWKFGDTTGTETWTVNAGNTITLAGTTPTIEVVNNSATLNSTVAGSAGLTKIGAGNLILAGSNTYAGGTTLTNGTLTVSNAAALGSGLLTIGSNANNPYLNNTSGSSITSSNNMVWSGNYRIGGTWNFGTAPVSLLTSMTVENYGTVTVGGVISGAFSVSKNGTGGLVFNGLNTYTGATVARQGTVTINTLRNYGQPSSLGAPASGNITIAANNSTTLAYTGTGDTTNRSIQVGGTTTGAVTATLANNGTGPLIFTAAAFNAPVAMTAGAARVLSLSGSFGTVATPNEVQGVIADNTLNGATAPANQISLTKGGTGAWKLSGANTYTGATTINGGTLILGANNVLPSTTNLSIGAATLDADTRTDTLGTLNVTAAATIRLGSGAALVFADSSAVTWAGTLSITGTFVSGSSLRFGTSATALTATQLSKISGGGFTSFSLNSSGFLVGNGSGATYSITNSTSDPNGTCTPTGVTSVSSGGSQTYTLTPAAGYVVDTLTVNGAAVPPALSYTFSNVTANQTIIATFAPATSLFWDSDGTTAGFGSTTGTWGTSAFWSPDSTGASPPVGTTTTTGTSVNFGSATANYNQSTVTIPAGGVSVGDMTFGAAQSTALTLSGGAITLFDTSTLTVNHPSTPITISSALTGASSSLTKAGSGVLSLSGANAYSGNTIISSGTLRLGASNVIPDGAGNGNVTLNGTLNLNAFSETLNGLSGSGTVDTIAGTTSTLTLGANDSTSTFTGSIINTTGTLSVIKTGLGTLTLAGANTYSGATILSAGTLRLTTSNSSLAGGLTFGSAAGSTAVSTLELSTASATFGGAVLVRTNSTTGNAITIGAGSTLQLGAAFTVGYNTTTLPHSTTRLNVSGAGTLAIGTSVTPTNANIQIGNGATTNVGNAGILDMSGLTTFYANLGTGLFRVGSPTNSGSSNGGASSVILAANSTIQAATMLLGGPDGAVNAGATAVQSLKLGSGTNILNVDTLNLGGLGTGDGRSNGSITFNDVTGTLKIRSQGDPINGRAALNIGVRAMETGVAAVLHLFDSTGHDADLMLGTMTIGSRSTSGSLTGSVAAEFRFDTGTLDANDLIIGSRSGTSANAATGTGIVTLGGGSVTLNSVNNPVQLGVNTIAAGNGTGTLNISGGTVNVLANTGVSIRIANATTAGGTATGTLNLTGGTLSLQGDIARGASTGTSNATVKLSGGTLNMNGHDIGAAGSGALTFTVESGTLQNIASINGTGGLTKTTAGTLTVAGSNTYTGPTTISAGTLALAASNALPATPLTIAAATLNADTYTDTLGTLDLSAAATINLGTGAALSFDDSSAMAWSGTLTITGTFVSGSSLRFGTTSTALTATQLGKISAVGFSSFTLDANGYLIGNTAPTYANWQTTNGVSGTFTADHDDDGVPNGIEFFLGGSSNTTGQTSLPPITDTAGALSITWTKSSTYPGTYGTHFTVETSDTLTGTWVTETLGVNVNITDNQVKYTFPAGDTRKFVRLKVVGP